MPTQKVLLFATLRDLAAPTVTVELPAEATVSDLRDALSNAYPALKPYIEDAIVAINHDFALEDEQIPPNAEIAVFPPVSGG